MKKGDIYRVALSKTEQHRFGLSPSTILSRLGYRYTKRTVNGMYYVYIIR